MVVSPFSQVLKHFLNTHNGSFGVVTIDDIKNLHPGDLVTVWAIAYSSDPYFKDGMSCRFREADSGEMPWLIL